ncbi:hypothetical protein GCM10025874_22720 [Arenivirga flava]|uniref:DUF11 domain-containing protein n=1 Tax=Arenivirga flava TaxID=1930060 RepID=A0AA37UEZ5_9MICO|nr:hypothetical protein GCM10025874_22720 [Arenivirga flava]
MLTARTTRLRRALIAALGALVAAPVLLGAQPAQATVSTDALQDEVTASVRIAGEGDLVPGDDLRLQVTVDNASAVDVPESVATVALGDGPLRQESALSAWLAGDDDVQQRARRTVGWLETPAIAAGQRSSFELTVPAGNLGIRDDPTVWGVRLLALDLDLGEGRDVQARSSVTWLPEGVESQQRVATVVPLTSGVATTTGVLDEGQLTALTGEQGRLRTRLDAATAAGATIAVDPMVLASIRRLGTSAPAAAAAWLADLEASTLDSFLLGYGDVDPIELLRANGASLRSPASLDFAMDAADFAEEPAPTPSATASPTATPATEAPDDDTALPDVAALTAWEPTLPELVWPVGAVAPAQLDGLVGAQSALLDDRSLASVPADSARIDTALPTVVERSAVSRAVAQAASATSTAAWQTAMARVKALLAVDARAGSATVVAALPRDGAETPASTTPSAPSARSLGALRARSSTRWTSPSPRPRPPTSPYQTASRPSTAWSARA